MIVQSHADRHIDITAALARLYLFLAQSIDRCVSEGTQIDYPEAELQAHLVSTRAAVLDMLAGNQVVKAKVEQECDRVHALILACLRDRAAKSVALDELMAERAVLKHKTMVLTDLLAVFRTA
ncbi:MAG: hypothetical protein OEV01_14920 [Nitrospira sp.]|nr:hypothetical protein [Nitrospira sp.]MDH4304263.1 hypothetical protein [Nitrospira sp.]MDH5195290.1 hypothetical protein [Nitrospira sp.]